MWFCGSLIISQLIELHLYPAMLNDFCKAVDYFQKKLHFRLLTGFWIHLWCKPIIAGNYIFKINNRNINVRRRSGASIVNFEHISHLVLVFLLLTLNMYLPVGYHICENRTQLEQSLQNVNINVKVLVLCTLSIDTYIKIFLHKKWSFPLKISFVNVTKPGDCGFGYIY